MKKIMWICNECDRSGTEEEFLRNLQRRCPECNSCEVQMIYVVNLPIYDMEIILDNNVFPCGGRLSSNLKFTDDPEDDDPEYCIAADTVENFILAMACEGIDVTDPRMINAITTIGDSIANEYL